MAMMPCDSDGAICHVVVLSGAHSTASMDWLHMIYAVRSNVHVRYMPYIAV